MAEQRWSDDLERYGGGTLDQDGCVTCGDLAVAVRVLRVEGREALCVDRCGRQAWVAIDFVPQAAPGDVLLVHLRVALTRIEGDEP